MTAELAQQGEGYKSMLSKRNEYKDVLSTRKAKEEELSAMISQDKIDLQVTPLLKQIATAKAGGGGQEVQGEGNSYRRGDEDCGEVQLFQSSRGADYQSFG